MPRKRKPKYTKKLCKKILSLIEDKKTLAHICRLPGMPCRRTVYNWREKYPEFDDSFHVSEDIRLSGLIDEMIENTDISSYDRLCERLKEEPSKAQLYSEENRIRERNNNTKFFASKMITSIRRRDEKKDSQPTEFVIKSYQSETNIDGTKPLQGVVKDLQPQHLKTYDGYTDQQKEQMRQFNANK